MDVVTYCQVGTCLCVTYDEDDRTRQCKCGHAMNDHAVEDSE